MRLWAGLLTLGAVLLLYRTIAMMTDGSLAVLVPWVAATVVVEAAMDAAEVFWAGRWFVTRASRDERIALRLGAAVAIVHALRVLIFVLGRTGPWVDFDVRPGLRGTGRASASAASVYFAGTMALLGVAAVVVIWRVRRRARGQLQSVVGRTRKSS
jgi:hypothetical protein